MLRGFVRGWIRLALWFRFRDIQIVYHSSLPTSQAAILAGNHQNGILDSMTLAALSPKTPFTLSRGSLFQNPLARKILESLRMLPIYRFRDGFGGMRKNQEMFAQFVDVLKTDGWLLMFPEGSHFITYTLRPLQKGAARIAFATQDALGWATEVPIIPVGLQYESHRTFGSRLLIQYGRPMSTLEFKDLHARDPKSSERALTARLFDEIRRLIVVFPADTGRYEEALDSWNRTRGQYRDLMEQFRADKKRFEDPLSAVDGPGFRGGQEVRPWGKVVGYALSLPGLLLHLPVLLFIFAWEKLFVDDLHLRPAARFAGGMVLFPLWYLTVLGLSLAQSGSLASTFFLLLLLPFSLWLWSRNWHRTR